MKQKESSVKSSELLKSNLSEKILSKRKIDGNVTLQTFDADVFLLKPQESHVCLLESFRKDLNNVSRWRNIWDYIGL